MIPFSFLNTFDNDARTCINGPIITKAESATFLESDPCFSKANAPGAYKLECLQSRWTELGGTPDGTGYPNTQAKADAIQKDANGKPRNIDTIIDNLSVTMAKALTGKNGAIPLSIPEWNTVSMYATGVAINSPCDGPGAGSPACASYLYLNQGTASHIGPTYTASNIWATKKEGFVDPSIYNQPRTILDPNTSTGLAFTQPYGTDISALKSAYNNEFNKAIDNSKKNADRSLALKRAFDVTFVPMTNSIEGTISTEKFIGRYIHIQYNRRECLNLAQIDVYPDKSLRWKQTIPWTNVSNSSGYSGDAYPNQNYVNGLANTFVHTSCYDVPWIRVDLGENVPIYRIVITNRKDCCQSRIHGATLYIATDGIPGNSYQSYPINSTNSSYSWFPPDSTVYGDLPLSSDKP